MGRAHGGETGSHLDEFPSHAKRCLSRVCSAAALLFSRRYQIKISRTAISYSVTAQIRAAERLDSFSFLVGHSPRRREEDVAIYTEGEATDEPAYAADWCGRCHRQVRNAVSSTDSGIPAFNGVWRRRIVVEEFGSHRCRGRARASTFARRTSRSSGSRRAVFAARIRWWIGVGWCSACMGLRNRVRTVCGGFRGRESYTVRPTASLFRWRDGGKS